MDANNAIFLFWGEGEIKESSKIKPCKAYDDLTKIQLKPSKISHILLSII